MDAATEYLQTFETLRRRKRWTVDTNVLRFSALALGSLDIPDAYARLEEAAETLRKGTGWCGPMKSSVRYVVAAMILRQGLPVDRVQGEVKRTRERLKRYRVPRSSLPATLASLLLVLDQQGGSVSVGTLDRVERILARWKKDHRWLTGADDLPTAALHAARDVSVESIALETERAYQRLREQGFSRGNQLQLVSHMLAFDPRGVDTATGRFIRVVRRFEDQGRKIRSSRYDEAAILALSAAGPAAVVDRTMRFEAKLREKRPKPSRDIAFSLASGLVLAEDARQATGKQAISDLGQLRAVQAIVAAQQAAMIAAIAASSAAASSAASSG